MSENNSSNLVTSSGKIIEFFNNHKDFVETLKNFKKEYDLKSGSSFNIFSSISDTYHKENLHSAILKIILDPNTPDIGNPKNIELFVNLLKTVDPKISLNIKFSNEIIVECEKGRIDVLVYDKVNKWAIIIENKINNAPDMDNQLGRYYEKVKKMGYSPKAVVYLTLTKYSKEFDEKKSIKTNEKEIKSILIHVSAINNDNKEYTLTEGFLKKCIDHPNNDELARVYYNQYYKLLKFLGGDIMAMDIYKEVINKIYPNYVEAFKTFGELWNNRRVIFSEVIKDILITKGFKDDYPKEPQNIYKKINKFISLGFDTSELSIGFVCTTSESPFGISAKKDLESIWDDDNIKKWEGENKTKLKDIFIDTPVDSNAYWVDRNIDINKLNDFNDILDWYKYLEEGLKIHLNISA